MPVRYWVIIGLIIYTIIAMFFNGGITVGKPDRGERVCLEYVTVLDILHVHYRSATILTERGEIVLNQSNVRDGDVLCWRRGYEDERSAQDNQPSPSE